MLTRAAQQQLEGLDDELFDESRIAFPCREIPPEREYFQGRTETLEAIKNHLVKSDDHVRSFAIYGLGGVGKTSLALKFAHDCWTNRTYDAIFWIKSETSFALKQSFTDIACRLNLPDAQHGDHDSNIIQVKNWLNQTRKYLF